MHGRLPPYASCLGVATWLHVFCSTGCRQGMKVHAVEESAFTFMCPQALTTDRMQASSDTEIAGKVPPAGVQVAARGALQCKSSSRKLDMSELSLPEPVEELVLRTK